MNVRAVAAALILAFLSLSCSAQSPSLRIPEFDHLRARAVETVDIDIAGWLLRWLAWLLDEEDPQDAEARAVLKGLRGVRVRSYEFETDHAYSMADLEAVRRQLSGPGWRPLVQVRKPVERSEVDVYVSMDGETIDGLAIVASEPREFTIVHIAGQIDPDDLGKIEGHVGIDGLHARLAVR